MRVICEILAVSAVEMVQVAVAILVIAITNFTIEAWLASAFSGGISNDHGLS